MLKLRLPLALLLVVAAGCRDGSSGDDDDDGAGADGGGGDDVTIYQVQDDAMEPGTAVTVRGVVVTAIDAYGKYKGDFFVQEPEGGPFSGVQVFASAEIAAELEVGDLVDIENAVKDEFALQEDETGRKLTELKSAEGAPLTVTKVGEGAVPEPVVVQPWELTASDDEAEKWEGVPVRFEGARVFYAPSKAMTDMTREEMTVTGPYRIESALTDLDDAIARDACFASITGIGSYFFNHKILPRTADDLVLGEDADCLPAEASVALCEDDGIDNDYNGYADCADFGCQEAVASCTADTTIAAIQAGEVADNTRVRVSDVMVTAKSFNQKQLWLQVPETGGENTGVFVYSKSNPTGVMHGDKFMDVSVGDKVTVLATVSDYDCGGACADNPITELVGVEVEARAAGDDDDMPAPVTGLTLSEAMAEPYEGVLVTLESVSTGAVHDSLGGDSGMVLLSREYAISSGAATIYVDDDVYRVEAAPSSGSCQTVTGIMHFNSRDYSGATPAGLPPHITIIPRSASDIQAAPGCE